MLRLYKFPLIIFCCMTFIVLIWLSVPQERVWIERNFKSVVIQNVSKHDDLERVLLDLNISTNVVLPSKMCLRENYWSKQKTIVIVPYRNRAENFKFFIPALHQHLMNQVSALFVYEVFSKFCNNNFRP